MQILEVVRIIGHGRREAIVDRPQLLRKVVEWLRAGYPNGVPQGDYIPLVALLRRQLSGEELDHVTAELIDDSLHQLEPISKIDAGVKITKVTDELPNEADIARVRELLFAGGWPFDDEPLADTLPSESPRPPAAEQPPESAGTGEADNTGEDEDEPGDRS